MSPGALRRALAAATLLLVGTSACTTVAVPPAGTAFKDCADCPEMVVVPPGSFSMGAS